MKVETEIQIIKQDIIRHETVLIIHNKRAFSLDGKKQEDKRLSSVYSKNI